MADVPNFRMFSELDAPIVGSAEHEAFKRLLASADFAVFRRYVESHLIRSASELVANPSPVERREMLDELAGATMFWRRAIHLMERLDRREENV